MLVSGLRRIGRARPPRTARAPTARPVATRACASISVAYVGFTTHNEPAVAGSDAADARLWAIDDLAIAGVGSDDGVPLAFDHAQIISDGDRTVARQARVHDARDRVPRRAVHARRAAPRLRSGVGRSAARRELPAQGAVDARLRRSHRRHRADRRAARRAVPARPRDPPAPADPAPMITGVYPGSFDPLTVAHLAIAEAAQRRRTDSIASISRCRASRSARKTARIRASRRGPRRSGARRGTRPWLAVAITDAQLIAEIAAGYDVVVMGADKWAQVRDPGLVRRRHRGPRPRAGRAAARPRRASARLRGRRRGSARHRPRARARLVDARPGRRTSPRRARRPPPAPRRREQRRRQQARRLVARPRGRDPPARRRAAITRDAHRRRGDGRVRRSTRSPISRRACTTACASRTRAVPGRDAGDDRIVDEVRGDDDPVVAHRRHVGSRARAARARARARDVEGAGALTRELE